MFCTNEIKERVDLLYLEYLERSPYVRFTCLPEGNTPLTVFGSYCDTLPESRGKVHYWSATLAAWSVKRPTAIMTAKPVANFTNSIKNGSALFGAERVLFLGLFIRSNSGEEIRVRREHLGMRHTESYHNSICTRFVAGKICHFRQIIDRGNVR